MDNESSSAPDLNANPGATREAGENYKIKLPEPVPRKITSLADLKAICEQKFTVELSLLGSDPVQIEGRQLTPTESSTLDDMERGVIPPSVGGEKGQEARFNFNDAAYMRTKATMRLTVRALALYWAYPMFNEAKPNMSDPAMIREFVQHAGLTDMVLQVLHQALQTGGVRKIDIVNFLSAPSQPS